MSNHRFGLSQFSMRRVVKQFYKVYMYFMLIPLVLIIAPFLFFGIERGLHLNEAKEAKHAQISTPYIMVFVDVQPQKKIVLAAAGEVQKVERVYSDNAPPEHPQTQAELPQEKTFDERMKERGPARKDKIRTMLQDATVGGWWWVLISYVFIGFAFSGYIKSRIGNLIWNNTILDKLSFKSSLRARDFMWLYFTNMLAIMFTAGLATPWAQIRMARYRTSKLQIVGDVDFDQFVGDKKEQVKATGEEIADMFDVDLSFG